MLRKEKKMLGRKLPLPASQARAEQDCKPGPIPEIEREMNVLKEEIDRVHFAFDELEKKLSKIICREVEASGDESSEKYEIYTQLGEEIRAYRLNITNLVERIQSVTKRLGV
jgi:hypothetical protein